VKTSSLAADWPVVNMINFIKTVNIINVVQTTVDRMWSGSLVAAVCRIFRLRLEKTASRYGAYLRIDWIGSRRQQIRGGPPARSLGEGLTLQRKSQLVNEVLQGPRTWTDFLERRRHWKTCMRFGTWSVKSLQRAGSLKAVESELAKYKIR